MGVCVFRFLKATYLIFEGFIFFLFKAAQVAEESLEESSRGGDQSFQDYLEDKNMFPTHQEIER